jgi:predicted methyltransferase
MTPTRRAPPIRFGIALAALSVAGLAGTPRALAAAESPYAQALAAPGRSAQDLERDARDKPAEVLAFAGFKRGMRIADIFGAAGYYSEILTHVVGPDGKVLLVNNPPYARFAAKGLAERFKDGRLPEIERIVAPSDNLGLGHQKLDAALFVMSYHDLYWEDKDGFPHIDAAQFLEQIRDAIKPGGLLLIVDHAAVAGTGNSAAQTLHRIDEQFAVKDWGAHGFELVKNYDGLRNSADDHLKAVFDPSIRGKTDRFVQLYRRR